MDDDLTRAIQWLFNASMAVGDDYIRLPVAGQEGTEYRERVYCYELYHRWRMLWEPGFPYTLCGEIDKQGHPIIRTAAKPDFLVHAPGLMQNLLAIEVKPANAKTRKFVKDLVTLTYFRRSLGDGQNYFAACLLTYGIDEARWNRRALRILRSTSFHRHAASIDLRLIRPAVQSVAGQPARFVEWPGA